MTITAASTVADFRAAVEALGACQEALDWLGAQPGPLLDTLAQMDREWCLWARFNVDCDAVVRMALLDRGTDDWPRMAAHLEIYRQDLSEGEMLLLKARWSEEMFPVIAQQIADGIIVRPEV